LSPRFTLDQLVVIDAIDRTGSFAAAARELCRVPSAVSYAVRTLEEALGVPLFDRGAQRAALTPAGRRLVVVAGVVLRRARRMEQLAGALGGGWEPELKVVVDGSLPLTPLMRALQALVAQQVPTRVQLDIEHQDGVLDRFDADQADLMLALGLEDGGRLQGVPLPPLEMALVVGAGHPLAGRASLDTEALAEHVDLVVKDSSPRFSQSPRKAFLGSRRVLRVSDFGAKRAALLAQVGFGWMPLHLIEEELRSGLLALVDLPGGNRWTYHPQLISRRNEPPGRARALLMALLTGPIPQET
jgi:DNA-binding transcriptional LysR family regulator